MTNSNHKNLTTNQGVPVGDNQEQLVTADLPFLMITI